MPLYRINGKSVLFIHIPKTGGTSIEDWLREHRSEALFTPKTPDGHVCSPQHFHSNMLKQIIPEGYVDYAFTIIRHPIERFLSEFFYRNRRKKFRPKWHLRMKPVLSARPQELAYYFRNWTSEAFARYRANQFASDNHIRPQSHFIDCENLTIFRFEQGFSKIFEQLSQDLGVNHPPCRVAKKLSKRVRFEIQAKTLEQIEYFYEEDFRRLIYSKHIVRLRYTESIADT